MLKHFTDVYIERCDKESETMIANESQSFLTQSIEYFKNHKNEFIYLESDNLDKIKVDATSLEIDDVFGTYDVLLGLKLQKKFDPAIRTYLQTHLHGEHAKFELMFNQGDGLWDLNFALNYVDGFKEDMTIGEAFDLVYSFISGLIQSIEA